MKSDSQQWRAFCTSEGPAIPVPSKISGLGYHFSNLRLKEKKKGSREWKAVALHETRRLGQPELVPIIGTVQSPKDPFNVYIGKPKPDRKAVEPCPNPDWIKPKTRNYPAKQFNDQIEAAIADLERRHPDFTSFVSLHMCISIDYRVAHQSVIDSRKVLQGFLNRRFPGHIALIFFEVDEKLAKDVDAAVVPDNSWRRGISPNRIVYDVHCHGAIFTPNVRSVDLAKAFRFAPNGKLSKLFSGPRQVHVQPLYQITDGNRTILDVRGISGYSTKNHYRPAVDGHELEGFPEWLFIQDKIVHDPQSVLISGMRSFTPYPDGRPTLPRLRTEMRRQWNRLTLDQREEEMRVSVLDLEDEHMEQALFASCPDPENSPSPERLDILNSDGLSDWGETVKMAWKKSTSIFRVIRRSMLNKACSLLRFFAKVRTRGDPGWK